MPVTTTLRHVAEPLGAALIRLDDVAAGRARKSVIQNIADVGGWEAPEEGTERYRMLEAALASRGMAWRYLGSEGCHDGWSLVRACAGAATERDGIDVERVGQWGTSIDQARMALTQWGMTEVRLRHATPGDVLLFEVADGERPTAIHAGVMSAPGGDLSWAMLPGRTIPEAKAIHAYPARAVCECWLGPWWTTKLIAAFSFDTARKARPFRLEAA